MSTHARSTMPEPRETELAHLRRQGRRRLPFARVVLALALVASLTAGCGVVDNDAAVASPTANVEQPPAGRDLTPGDLPDLLPPLDAVQQATGLELSEREVKNDLSQAFEGVDLAQVEDGYIGVYRSQPDGDGLIVDLALFNQEDDARAFLEAIEQTLSDEPRGDAIALEGVADEAVGYVASREDGGRMAIAYLRSDRLVSIILAMSDDEIPAEGIRALAEHVAREAASSPE